MQTFELCESLNAVGTVLDLHKLLENRKASPEARIAGLEALGEVSKAAGTSAMTAVSRSLSMAAHVAISARL